MPARNAADTIDIAMRSVLRCRVVPLELIVVDHRSSDATSDLVQKCADRDPRVRLVRAEYAEGLGAALMVGLSVTRAPLIARMDSDDVMHRDRLPTDVAFMAEHPEISVVTSMTRLFRRRDVRPRFRAYVNWINSVRTPDEFMRDFWIEQPLCHPATTVRRAVFDDVGGYTDGPYPEDYEFFLRAHVRGHRFHKHARALHAWRVHPLQATRTDPRYDRANHARLKVRMMREHFSLDDKSIVIAGAGKEGGRFARALVAEGLSPARFVDVSEKRIGRIRYDVRVESSDALSSLRESLDDAFLVGAVGTPGARGIVRSVAQDAGFTEGVDFVVVC